MKSALKFLFARGIANHPIKWIITLGFAFVMLAAEFLWMVPQGEEDFLLSKMMFNYVIQLTPIIIMILLNSETAGNRAIRAFPCAKAMYTRAIPFFSGILSCGLTAVFVLLYAAGVLFMGESPVQISEMIVVSFPLMILYSLICGIAPLFRFGVLIMIYVPLLLNVVIAFLPISKDILYNGTGLPLWAAVLIFVGGAVASVAISCVANSIIYKKANFKSAMMNTVTAK